MIPSIMLLIIPHSTVETYYLVNTMHFNIAHEACAATSATTKYRRTNCSSDCTVVQKTTCVKCSIGLLLHVQLY